MNDESPRQGAPDQHHPGRTIGPLTIELADVSAVADGLWRIDLTADWGTGPRPFLAHVSTGDMLNTLAYPEAMERLTPVRQIRHFFEGLTVR